MSHHALYFKMFIQLRMSYVGDSQLDDLDFCEMYSHVLLKSFWKFLIIILKSKTFKGPKAMRKFVRKKILGNVESIQGNSIQRNLNFFLWKKIMKFYISYFTDFCQQYNWNSNAELNIFSPVISKVSISKRKISTNAHFQKKSFITH